MTTPPGASPDPAAAPSPRTSPPYRPAVLGAVIVGMLMVAVTFFKQPPAEGAVPIAFQPATWRCDGTERAWTADLPAAFPNLVIQLRVGSTGGLVATETGTTLAALRAEQAAQATPTGHEESGGVRVVTTDTTAPECSLAPGPYALVVLDAASGAMLASGIVDIQP